MNIFKKKCDVISNISRTPFSPLNFRQKMCILYMRKHSTLGITCQRMNNTSFLGNYTGYFMGLLKANYKHEVLQAGEGHTDRGTTTVSQMVYESN
jgi:hypothetical protein